MTDHTRISLAHGNGGRYMRELIRKHFARHLHNPLLDIDSDAVVLPDLKGIPVMTTDGFIVQPLFFPGGDIGSLAVHGTLNDLAVAGAEPMYLTLNAFIEEGMEIEKLDRIIANMARAAAAGNVKVVAGDTKVVPKGRGGELYLATTGLGIRSPRLQLGLDRIQKGDRILVSGPVGDHGTAVMLSREQFGLHGDVQSDAASVLPLTRLLHSLPGLRFMRDPTRGGLATVMHEILQGRQWGILLEEPAIPVRDEVRTVCDILGFDPLYLACEGRVVAVVEAQQAEQALSRWQTLPEGRQAAIIGTITDTPCVTLQTILGGQRLLEELEEDPLPRIC